METKRFKTEVESDQWQRVKRRKRKIERGMGKKKVGKDGKKKKKKDKNTQLIKHH